MRLSFIILFLFLSHTIVAQSFEGTLTYKVEFDIKSQKFGGREITKKDILDRMKEKGEFFDTVAISIKGGHYSRTDNINHDRRSIYRSDSNKIFTFQNDLEDIFITDASQENVLNLKLPDPKIEKLDSVKNINGIPCKLMKYTWGNLGSEYYFYNPEVAKINPELFKGHKSDNLNQVLAATGSYPLETIKIMNNFISVKLTLISLQKEPINNELFNIEKIKAEKNALKQNKTTNWVSFKDEAMGYSLEYPENYVTRGSKGGFMCGKKKGLLYAEYTIWWCDPNDEERIEMFFNVDGLYEGYDVVEKPITLNGTKGTYYLRTHKEKPDEYYESIILKTESKWYNISNVGTKDKWFKHFYESFKLMH